MSAKQSFLDRIQDKSARIGVIGIGYVGLPLAIEFAEAGFSVMAIDTSTEKVDLLNQGISYIEDIPSERLQAQVKAGRFTASSDYGVVKELDAVSICVPTPLRKTKDPDMSYIIQSVNAVADVAHEYMLIVLESTTYPGTTEEIVIPALEKKGFKDGETIYVAFSPERIDPGNQTYNVRNTPKVVGGSTPDACDIAVALYSHIIDQVVAVSSPTVAEMSKILENTFRAVNIALVNEMAIMCDRLGIDVWEVIHAAKTKPFGFMPFYPGPGLGGHCIPVDPHYLSWKLKTLNYNARFIELASEINTSMPFYVVDKITDALNEASKSIRGSRIVVLGVAYKPNINDMRESPALDVINLLMRKGADVVYHDPHVPSIRLEDSQMMESCDYETGLLEAADCVVIITHHDYYDWESVIKHSPLIVDTRNVTNGYPSDKPIIKL
ncbi:nucleotide sugar dehydrogenase [Anaerolineales bacterium]